MVVVGERTTTLLPPPTARKDLGYRPALDGVRAAAVALVMAFHFVHSAVPGGYLGVDVFFALSGFLITSLLLSEHRRSGKISLRRFYERRARRLLPALVAFLATWMLLAAFVGRRGWFGAGPFGPPHAAALPLHVDLLGVLAAATYSFNWWRAFDLRLPPFGNLWSLSVEEQFYLLWPVVVWVLLRRRPRALLPATLLLVAASACLPPLLWHGGAGADRIYFGTDTRIPELLLGSAAAQLWARGSLDWMLPGRRHAIAAAVGALTIGGLALGLGNQAFKYLGASTVAALASCAFVTYLAGAPSGRVVGLFCSRPAVWLGERSYAVYLWHPVIAGWVRTLPRALGVLLGVALSLAAAELSWRFVETRFRAPARRRPALHGQPAENMLAT